MSPRRQATADRSWFRPRPAATAPDEGDQADSGDGSGRVNGNSMPLAAPTPAAADAGTSAEAGPAPAGGPAGGSEPSAPGDNAPVTGSGNEADVHEPDVRDRAGGREMPGADQPAVAQESPGAPTSPVTASSAAAPAAQVAPGPAPRPAPDGPAMTRPAPWVHIGGPRRGTARTRAAEADLAARASAIAPPPEIILTAPDERPATVEPPAEPSLPGPPLAEPSTAGPAPRPVSPAATTPPAGSAAPGAREWRSVSLSARLMALARMIQIGAPRSSRDAFAPLLLADAEEVLARAGERMRLSSGHTVVVLAGGTGSGKSSLFNRLSGAELSTVGVTRPVTKDAHACVWGEQGSGPILEWLQVPGRHRYSRSSALDRGEEDLVGLVLLDLPDHDSVMSHAGELVDRLVGMADVMVWVLDPQKYADAAVHRRFLVPMAGHSAVVAVVLNQVDLLDPAQVDDCVADLRRLLDSENLHDVPIVVTSAATGTGLDDLRALLGRGVAARRAATARISADLDDVVSRFLPFAGDVSGWQAAPEPFDVPAQALADQVVAGRPVTGSSAQGEPSAAAGRTDMTAPAGADPRAEVPASARTRLAERFATAAGITAIGEALRSARELRAVDFVGWPVAWFAQRLTGRDPSRKARIGALWSDLRAVTAGPAGAQQAAIDNALTDLGAELARPLPKPWAATIKSAVRSRADEIPAAVGTAIGEALPAEDTVAWWWRLAGLWQGLLLGTAAVAIAWSLLIGVVRLLGAQQSMPGLMSDLVALPWLAAAAIAALGLGAATTWLCMKVVASTAERENAQVTADLRNRIAGVAQEMVIAQAEQELTEFVRYREEARIAASGMTPAEAG